MLLDVHRGVVSSSIPTNPQADLAPGDHWRLLWQSRDLIHSSLVPVLHSSLYLPSLLSNFAIFPTKSRKNIFFPMTWTMWLAFANEMKWRISDWYQKYSFWAKFIKPCIFLLAQPSSYAASLLIQGRGQETHVLKLPQLRYLLDQLTTHSTKTQTCEANKCIRPRAMKFYCGLLYRIIRATVNWLY